MLPLSVLEITPLPPSSTRKKALQGAAWVATQVERIGYTRIWFGEHHANPRIASTNPALQIMHAAFCTSRIRVGAGARLIANHPNLFTIEDYGFLASLFDGRVDLGVGRARGVARHSGALETTHAALIDPSDYPTFRTHLENLVGDEQIQRNFREVRGGFPDPLVRFFVAGSTSTGARLAGFVGAGFVYGQHIGHSMGVDACQSYRDTFTPSVFATTPYTCVCIAVVPVNRSKRSTKLDESAAHSRQAADGLLLGADQVSRSPTCLGWRNSGLADGSPEVVGNLLAELNPDELFVTSQVAEPRERVESLEAVRDAVMNAS